MSTAQLQAWNIALGKLNDKDTVGTAVQELTGLVARAMTTRNMSLFLSGLYTTNTNHSVASRKEVVRLLGVIGQFMTDQAYPELPRMVSFIATRLRDNDSGICTAATETMGLLARYVLVAAARGDVGDSASLAVLIKPLLGVMATQDRQAQVGAAECLCEVVRQADFLLKYECSRLVPRLIKILGSPTCMAPEGPLDVLAAVMLNAGSVVMELVPDIVKTAIQHLADEDWHGRRAAAACLGATSTLGDSVSIFAREIVDVLDTVRFDRIKTVRDEVTNTLQLFEPLIAFSAPDMGEVEAPPLAVSDDEGTKAVLPPLLPPSDGRPVSVSASGCTQMISPRRRPSLGKERRKMTRPGGRPKLTRTTTASPRVDQGQTADHPDGQVTPRATFSRSQTIPAQPPVVPAMPETGLTVSAVMDMLKDLKKSFEDFTHSTDAKLDEVVGRLANVEDKVAQIEDQARAPAKSHTVTRTPKRATPAPARRSAPPPLQSSPVVSRVASRAQVVPAGPSQAQAEADAMDAAFAAMVESIRMGDVQDGFTAVVEHSPTIFELVEALAATDPCLDQLSPAIAGRLATLLVAAVNRGEFVAQIVPWTNQLIEERIAVPDKLVSDLYQACHGVEGYRPTVELIEAIHPAILGAAG
ncbi:ARM repeat superfamily protein, putative isoform 2 [Carpediemonas membranifera]|uniref:ARM repeat superfamily protein, putative isoform 2 n=1 Tax=Carpediemonas membranifera TaxID=201153 RepID=A0A8J6DZR8_9EUKA|nr:ARM repeat superfamily protein, putative isoform 2 [Carpediemonas membranifera]|eukprot:KAG9391118.1 ARM repeat superfamily protein, putative isoform 2 [Carpediemonas membranifera]